MPGVVIVTTAEGMIVMAGITAALKSFVHALTSTVLEISFGSAFLAFTISFSSYPDLPWITY